jgi:2-amino-4-hydroxy-6-hydroxymethyldihydropteridine diphosphokinase
LKTADKNRVFLSLGSNISPRQLYLSESLHLLQESFPFRFRVSSLYATRPFQGVNQQSYINCSAECWTDLKPLEMLDTISAIEARVGRTRSGKKWESRIIDIDIVLWGKQVIEHPRLTIPHYDLCNRDFFLIPLVELDNTLIHPVSGDLLLNELGKISQQLLTYPTKIDQDG